MTETVDAPTRPSGRNYVGGAWVPASSGETYTKLNPMRPSESVGEFSSSSEADADAAVAAAEAAFAEWAALPMARRAAYLNGAAAVLEARTEQVARDMTTEMGKPLREARGEAGRAAQILRFAASEAFRSVGEHFEQAATGAQVSTRRRPIGVVALITPWNFPMAIPIWKLAPALVYGNTVVLKLAYEAPRTGLHIAEAFAEAELPAGVLNVLTGRGSTAGAALVSDPRVRAISFTGSVATGHSVRDDATKLGKRVQLELGGHNPLIVTADADLDRAVEAAYAGAFWSAGQKCTATRRIYVQDAVYDPFKQQLLARIERGKVGDPLDPDVEVGPIVNEQQFGEVMAAIERGREEGGEVAAGGVRADDEAYLIAPTVFEGVGDDAFLSCEEVFGPVTSLYRYTTLDEALQRANATQFGLSAGIFTSSLADATRFQNEAQAGLLHVNSQTAGADVHVPFGGIKSSGFGPHEQGRAAIEFYTETVTVYVDPVSVERFLVTGALGCIGAWTCALLAEEGTGVVGFDFGTDDRRLRLVTDAEVQLVQGDIVDGKAFACLLDEHGITHVIHLAALLVPQIKPDPPYGTAVNIGGTVNVLDAAKTRGIQVAYASSAAVYSNLDDTGGPVSNDAIGHPATFYGVHKQACEGMARIFWQEEQVPSIGIRPYIVYGPGRDNGLTASPTLAMAAAAAGEDYRIAFGGRTQMQFAPDTARVFIAAARAATEGARVFHLGGPAVSLAEVAAAIEEAAPGVSISVDEDTILPFPEELDGAPLEEALGGIEWTPLEEGVNATVERLRAVRA